MTRDSKTRRSLVKGVRLTNVGVFRKYRRYWVKGMLCSNGGDIELKAWFSRMHAILQSNSDIGLTVW
jgi:hypothetical protein